MDEQTHHHDRTDHDDVPENDPQGATQGGAIQGDSSHGESPHGAIQGDASPDRDLDERDDPHVRDDLAE